MNLYSSLADVLVLLHFIFVLFVILGLAAVWIGGFRGWAFVRDLRLRLAHLVAIGYVAAESILRVPCPLTVWEARLREKAGAGTYEGSFIQHWVHRVLFYQADEAVFATLYSGFFILVILSFWAVKPKRSGKS